MIYIGNMLDLFTKMVMTVGANANGGDVGGGGGDGHDNQEGAHYDNYIDWSLGDALSDEDIDLGANAQRVAHDDGAQRNLPGTAAVHRERLGVRLFVTKVFTSLLTADPILLTSFTPENYAVWTWIRPPADVAPIEGDANDPERNSPPRDTAVDSPSAHDDARGGPARAARRRASETARHLNFEGAAMDAGIEVHAHIAQSQMLQVFQKSVYMRTVGSIYIKSAWGPGIKTRRCPKHDFTKRSEQLSSIS